jgi:hypothetical protein
MSYEGEETMKIPFLGKAEHERVRVELMMKRGGWWCSMSVERDGERERSSVKGWRRCGLLRASGRGFYKGWRVSQAMGGGGSGSGRCYAAVVNGDFKSIKARIQGGK